MALFKKQKRSGNVGAIMLDTPGVIWPTGYHPLGDCPEVAAAVWQISDLVSMMPIMQKVNGINGDRRIWDELTRKIDINPYSCGTRSDFISWIAARMLLDGEAFVLPRTDRGMIVDLVPMPEANAQLRPDGTPYIVTWKGTVFEPDEVLHFKLHPDDRYPWRGSGPRVQLQQVVESLNQAQLTKAAFMKSEYRPPLIINVNSDADIADEEKRKKFSEGWLKRANPGEPYIIPADLMSVTSVKPLSLTDLAIRDGVELDKASVASIFGVPGFMVGLGEFKKDAYNSFVRTVVNQVATKIEQTLTKGLLLSSERYFRFNRRGLYAYDIDELNAIARGNYAAGLMTGNEARGWLDLDPKDGLDELVMLENYIPADKIADQKKLVQEGEDHDTE